MNRRGDLTHVKLSSLVVRAGLVQERARGRKVALDDGGAQLLHGLVRECALVLGHEALLQTLDLRLLVRGGSVARPRVREGGSTGPAARRHHTTHTQAKDRQAETRSHRHTSSHWRKGPQTKDQRPVQHREHSASA